MEKKLKVWLMVRNKGREDLIRVLEEAGCEVILGRLFTDTNCYTEKQILEQVPDMDGLMVSTGEFMTRRIMEAGKKLKVIAKRGVGVEQIDIQAATDLGILVTNTPTPENYLSVAEYTLTMILAMAKKLKLADYNARQRKWRSIQNIFLRGSTVGIVGLGRIGSRLAELLLKPFAVKLLAYDPYVSTEKARMLGVELTDLDTLLKESDFVTLHAVATEENREMIGEAQLRMMKPTAYFINIARGGLVNEAAVAKALKEDWIAGAAIDVFEPEVPEPDNPLLDEDISLKTLYSPHVAGQNPQVRESILQAQFSDCLKGIKGEIPQYVVNPEAIPKWRERLASGL